MRKWLFTLVIMSIITMMGFVAGRITIDCKDKICAKSVSGKDRVEIEYRTEYKDKNCPLCKCKKRKPVIIPKINYPKEWCHPKCSKSCEKRLKICKQSTEDIQSWCNPYCQEQLDECQTSLTTFYSPYFYTRP